MTDRLPSSLTPTQVKSLELAVARTAEKIEKGKGGGRVYVCYKEGMGFLTLTKAVAKEMKAVRVPLRLIAERYTNTVADQEPGHLLGPRTSKFIKNLQF